MWAEWEPDELIAAWTLTGGDWDLIANKVGVTRLGFAVMLKFYEIEGMAAAGRVGYGAEAGGGLLAEPDIAAGAGQVLAAGLGACETPAAAARDTTRPPRRVAGRRLAHRGRGCTRLIGPRRRSPVPRARRSTRARTRRPGRPATIRASHSAPGPPAPRRPGSRRSW